MQAIHVPPNGLAFFCGQGSFKRLIWLRIRLLMWSQKDTSSAFSVTATYFPLPSSRWLFTSYFIAFNTVILNRRACSPGIHFLPFCHPTGDCRAYSFPSLGRRNCWLFSSQHRPSEDWPWEGRTLHFLPFAHTDFSKPLPHFIRWAFAASRGFSVTINHWAVRR